MKLFYRVIGRLSVALIVIRRLDCNPGYLGRIVLLCPDG